MARVRWIEIKNFRGIHEMDWFPGSGIKGLIGPGDVGKSTGLDAVDLCLGARVARFSFPIQTSTCAASLISARSSALPRDLPNVEG